MCASRRERDVGWQACRAGRLPRRAAEASGQLRGSPFRGPFLRSSKASRPLVSSAKPSFVLAAFLHLATSGVSWMGMGRSSARLRWGLGLSTAVLPRPRSR